MESLTQRRQDSPDNDAAVRLYRFGVFELDPRAGELRRQGQKIKVQKKSLQLLLLLVERAGELVLRDELRAGLWPVDTFVDFDANIKTALNRLRQSLGDSAENPVFIETIPKAGCRFIAPVTKVERLKPSEVLALDSVLTVTGTSSNAAPRWWNLVTASALLLVIMTIGLTILARRKQSIPASSKSRVLLVLPFDNLGGDRTQDFFSDGVTDEMITLLGEQVSPGLSIIARTSAMQYRASHKALQQISHELGGVDYVLEGSVRRSGDHVAVNVQLFRVSDQAVLWAATYQRDVMDLLSVQEDVARRVSSSIVEKLATVPPTNPARTVNSEAYDAYLMGLYYQENKRKGQDLLTSLKYFQNAIEKDPNYALPYSGLAYSYLLAAGWEMVTPSEGYPKAKAASERALQLDTNLAEAHMTLATADHEFYWTWAEAEREFRRAIELNPNSSLAHKGYAEFLMQADRNEEALQEAQRAIDLDPFSLGIRMLKGLIYLFSGQYELAVQECTRINQLDPQFVPAHYFLGGAYAEEKRYQESIAELEAALKFSEGSPKMVAALAWIYAISGRRKDALRLLESLQREAKHRYVSPFSLAKIYAALGEKSKAFDSLQKAAGERSSDLMYLHHDPAFDNLHDDPRFVHLEKQIGFPAVVSASTTTQ